MSLILPQRGRMSVAPVDPYFSNVSLLLHGDGTNGSTSIIDTSTYNQTLTPYGGIQLSTGVKKYGLASIYFNGTNAYAVDTTPTGMSFGTGDFTVEYWVYPTALNSFKYVIDTRNSSTGRWAVYHSSITNSWEFFTGSASLITNISATLNTWQHVAWSRSGTTLRLFVGGVQRWSTTNSSNLLANAINLGRRYNSVDLLSGYLDDLRVTIGVARYTANFTPPAEAFPDR